ncbi:hypothetical protein [Tahibacter harae]|uniref:YqjK-like protein n=1 Tax=Tahibacter harae TaxID=2963937 RepID=A0ABT1QW41_9GAMM|nr:hypothetical protein [Tahibacter harae]MCQ4166504.1 hypothetical protein [Tahibacter harae]
MIGRAGKLQTEVQASARRLDAALQEVDAEQNDVRRLTRAVPPKLLLGVGLAGGFLLMLLPRHLRGRTLIGLGRFALERLLPLLAGGGRE